MSEIISVPVGTLRARSLVAGSWRVGDWVPAGEYEVHRNPAGVFRCLIPAGQGTHHSGTFYYPLEKPKEIP